MRDHGNEIVKIGVAHGALAEASGKLGVSGRSSEGIVVNPGTNFAGEPKQLGRGLWMFGVEPAAETRALYASLA